MHEGLIFGILCYMEHLCAFVPHVWHTGWVGVALPCVIEDTLGH